MLRPIVRYGDARLHQAARAGRGDHARDRSAHRRHDRDDVRGARRSAWRRRRSACRCASSWSICRSVATRRQLLTLVNPEFVERDGMQLEEEGCLSVPGFTATRRAPGTRRRPRPRSRRARCRRVEGTGLLARAFQHEMDHLDGTALRRSAARHQARPDRAQDPQAERARASGEPRRRCGSSSSARRRSPCRHWRACSPRATSVVGVVTQPDRPRGRGQQVVGRAGQGAGRADAGLPVLQPERLRDDDSGSRFARSTPTSASSRPTARSCPSGCSRSRASA